MVKKIIAALFALGLFAGSPVHSAPATPKKPRRQSPSKSDQSAEAEYYETLSDSHSRGHHSGMRRLEILPDGKLAVGTRRGDIYLVEGAFENPPDQRKFTKWATGLHEILGLAYNKKDGFLYAVPAT